jgi:hypothetical protein
MVSVEAQPRGRVLRRGVIHSTDGDSRRPRPCGAHRALVPCQPQSGARGARGGCAAHGARRACSGSTGLPGPAGMARGGDVGRRSAVGSR